MGDNGRTSKKPSSSQLVRIPNPISKATNMNVTEATLERALNAAGFVIERLVTKKIVEREKFIYCRAVKP